MIVVAAGSHRLALDELREKHPEVNPRDPRVRIITPVSADRARGLVRKDGDKFLLGHFDPDVPLSEIRRREAMFENLRFGGWIR